jgi:ankyrin repeat protein
MVTAYPPIDWTEHPLHAAALRGNRAQVERLIAQGSDVNELLHLDVDGRQDLAGTPLHVALRNCREDGGLDRGHLEVVEILLAAGADVGLCRLWEGTPLHDAARLGLARIADLLISSGADVNSRGDYRGRTPLHVAATHGRLNMVDCLLNRGAEIDAGAVDGEGGHPGSDTSPYQRQYHEALQQSLQRRLFRYIGKTPLQMAAHDGPAEVVRRLLERGARLEIGHAIDLATRSRSPYDTRVNEAVMLEIVTLPEEKRRSAT